MKIFSYWEIWDGQNIPPYVLLCLVRLQRMYGEDFIILGPKDIGHYIDPSIRHIKQWGKEHKHWIPNSEPLVFTDFLRLKILEKEGGFWVDADNLIIKDFTVLLENPNYAHMFDDTNLFYSPANNTMLAKAAEKMLSNKHYAFNSMGDFFTDNWSELLHHPKICYYKEPFIQDIHTHADFLCRSDLAPQDVWESNQYYVSLMNTSIQKSKHEVLKNSVSDLLHSDTLLSKMFLALHEDINEWILEAQRMEIIVKEKQYE